MSGAREPDKEMKEKGADLFRRNAESFLEEIDNDFFKRDGGVNAPLSQFFGSTIERQVPAQQDPEIRTGVPKIVSLAHEEIVRVITSGDSSEYLKCIARLDALFSHFLKEPEKLSDDEKRYYKLVLRKLNKFRDKNIVTLQKAEEYEIASEEMNFELLVSGDNQLGKKYLEYKQQISNQEISLKRLRDFIEEIKPHIPENVYVMLGKTVDAVLLTYHEEDLSKYKKHLEEIFAKYCPPSALANQKSLTDTFFRDHQIIMKGISKQWKEFYARTLLSVVATVAAPVIGQSVEEIAVKGAVALTGAGVSAGGQSTSISDAKGGHIRVVTPKMTTKDAMDKAWANKGTAAKVVTKLVVSLAFPPAAAVLGGIDLVYSIKSMPGKILNEHTILSAREEASKRLLVAHDQEYAAFIASEAKVESSASAALSAGRMFQAPPVNQSVDSSPVSPPSPVTNQKKPR